MIGFARRARVLDFFSLFFGDRGDRLFAERIVRIFAGPEQVDPLRRVARILPPAPESQAARKRRLRREPVGPGHAAGTMPRAWWERLRRERKQFENRAV